jgi:hypothetical protein
VAHPVSYTVGTGSFSGVKRPGRGVDHPSPSSAEVKEKGRAIHLLLLWAFVVCSRLKSIIPKKFKSNYFCLNFVFGIFESQ